MTEHHPNAGASALEAARSVNIRRGEAGRGRPADGVTTAEAAARFNVSEKSVSRARAILDSGNLQLIQDVERGETSLAAAYCQLHQPIETPDDSPSLVPPQEKPRMLTHDTLQPAVEAVQSLIARWQEADNLQARAELYQPLVDALEQLNRMIDTDDCHPDAWPIVIAADELVTYSRQWIATVGELDPNVMQSANAACQAGQTDEKPEQLPPIEQMREQGRTYREIAQRYRWFVIDSEGRAIPDVSRVAMTLGDPSAPRIPGPHPATLRKQIETEQRWEARCRSRQANRPKRCPETIEQLLNQGVSLHQIARMHRVTLDEVKAEAASIGFWTNGEVIQYARENPDQRRIAQPEPEVASAASE